MSEPIWHNPKISKAALYFPRWFRSGIISVADMFTANRELLSQKDLEQSYSIKTNYLEYHRVKSCVKVYLFKLKLDLTDQQKPVYPNQIKILCNSNKGSQDFYWLLNYQCLDKNAPFLSWKNFLNLTIAENTWSHIFQICFKTVNLFIYLFGVLRRFQHCTGHITTGSWKGRGNQYIQFARVLYCKLPTNGKQLPAFPLKAMTGIKPRPQRWEARVLPLSHRGPFKTVKDNDLIWLQLRVLYKILGTNDLLLKMNKRGSGKCNFCDEQPETIVHLFVKCKIVKQFWFILKARIELVLQTNFNVNPSCIILGSLATNNLFHLKQFI